MYTYSHFVVMNSPKNTNLSTPNPAVIHTGPTTS